ncbi:MAG: hypothetical protein JW945_05545 [Methanomicrobia archaeon]|nr:hypothetical protein [Methanomicrobia archaeon]
MGLKTVKKAGTFLVMAVGIMLVLTLVSAQPSIAPEPATDEEVAFIRDQIAKWREDPDMKIGGISVDRGTYMVTLWVDEFTPKNQQLHHTRIDGWEIIVATSYEPSLSDTFHDILTNTPILWILAGCVLISLVVVFVKYRGRRKG